MNIAQFRILPAVFYSIVLFISVAANFRITEIQCPKRCTCIPDIAEQDRLVVTCKWLTTPNDNLWDQQLFSQLTQNITKSLSIECDNSQSEQQQHSNTVTFHENLLSKFQNLLNLRLQSRIYYKNHFRFANCFSKGQMFRSE
ncbi:unnamed protein product [Thelazia callipaeda]|uniref:Secreted protein n=1 Tax=Thelazia callipaeda TaxID=103827 RepID=A0A0N5CW90_THECL|nr:unnamed protein product [Thelazia callipaeda]